MLQIMRCSFNFFRYNSAVYWLPWSDCTRTPFGEPRCSMAISSASNTNWPLMLVLIDHSTTAREHRSMTVARYKYPCLVWMNVISLAHFSLGLPALKFLARWFNAGCYCSRCTYTRLWRFVRLAISWCLLISRSTWPLPTGSPSRLNTAWIRGEAITALMFNKYLFYRTYERLIGYFSCRWFSVQPVIITTTWYAYITHELYGVLICVFLDKGILHGCSFAHSGFF